jgi:glycerol uptake facilitator-like aquaporin
MFLTPLLTALPNLDQALSYIPGQMVGAMLGSLLVFIVYKDHYSATEDKGAKLATFSTAPAIRNTVSNLFSEIIGTFVLVFAVLQMSQPEHKLGASWLIDDNPEHCLSAIAHGIETVLFGEYGWHFNAPEHLTRCKDWRAVLEYFDAVER